MNISESDQNQQEESIESLEDRIYVMADEVLEILKQLSQDNKYQLDSKIIAERMFVRESVKKVLSRTPSIEHMPDRDSNVLKDVADAILNKFSDLTPDALMDELNYSKDRIKDESMLRDTSSWLDSTIKIIQKYYDGLSQRNRELEDFMQQTVHHLMETEQHLSSELTTHKERFTEDREFEDTLSSSMDRIKQDIHDGNDIRSIKSAVLKRIESINKGIEEKRELDLKRLRETEKTLVAMSNRITDIKKEANEIKKHAEEIQSQSLLDNLTGLYNRKAYDQKMIETMADLKRYNVPASLMVCDIDDFKKINDTFGHKVGDLALKKLASLLKEKLRVNDFIARYGGEEFVIILPNTDLAGASSAAAGVIDYINQAIFSYKDEKIPLTISIGVSFMTQSDDQNSIFDRADLALYKAKRSGKNTFRSESDLSGDESDSRPSAACHTSS